MFPPPSLSSRLSCNHVKADRHNRQGYEAELKPQSGRVLEPGQTKGVTQHSRVWHAGDRSRRVEGVKMRWRVSYRVGGEARSETGEVPEFGVA